MRKTRLRKKQELDFVLNEVFQKEDDDLMQVILRGPGRITDVESIIGMDPSELLSLKYFKEGETEAQTLNKSEIALMRALKCYVWRLNMTSDSIGNDFLKIDPEEFDNFRISDDWTKMVDQNQNVAVNTSLGSTASTNAASASNAFEFESHPSEHKELKIEFDAEVFEKNLLAATSQLKDDCSHSSHCSSTSEWSEFSSCKRIDELIINASNLLDD